jgi:hypothetical protein
VLVGLEVESTDRSSSRDGVVTRRSKEPARDLKLSSLSGSIKEGRL